LKSSRGVRDVFLPAEPTEETALQTAIKKPRLLAPALDPYHGDPVTFALLHFPDAGSEELETLDKKLYLHLKVQGLLHKVDDVQDKRKLEAAKAAHDMGDLRMVVEQWCSELERQIAQKTGKGKSHVTQVFHEYAAALVIAAETALQNEQNPHEAVRRVFFGFYKKLSKGGKRQFGL
jgi:hypothetical protein